MGGSQYGVGVQEGQEAAPGGAGPGVHLAASPAGGPQAVDLGMAGRHLPGVVGAAAVHQDDLQVGRGRQPARVEARSGASFNTGKMMEIRGFIGSLRSQP